MNNHDIDNLIKEEKYEEALKILLTQEKEYLKKVICLYESEKYRELKSFFEDIVDKIEEDYYEILGYYILSLIKLDDFDKALDTLNEELSLPYIQSDYLEVLNSLYDDVLGYKKAYLAEHHHHDLNENEIANILENTNDYNILLQAISSLNKINVRNILSSIEKFLLSDNSPILKSFVLEVLTNQQVSECLLVNKNNLEIEVMPIANQLVFDNHNYLLALEILNERFEKNPSYLEMAIDILNSYSYIIYPQTIGEDEVKFLCASIEYYLLTLNFEDMDKDFETFYCLALSDIINNIDWLVNILKLEERFIEDNDIH